MRELTIHKTEEGQRLDRYLGKYLPKASSGFLHKMLRKKNIKLNQAKADGSEKIKAGDTVQIYFSDETLETFRGRPVAASGKGNTENRTVGNQSGKNRDAGQDARYRDSGNGKPKSESRQQLTPMQEKLRSQVCLLAETEDMLIFHKPAGMLTQKARPEDDSLNDYLLDYCAQKGIYNEDSVFRPSVANRLDRNTSGIVLCGITTRGLQQLSRLLKERRLEKYYLCLVHGQVQKNQKIRGYLLKNEETNVVKLFREPVPGAAPIETWYEVLAANQSISLLRVRLVTGKSHQIRVHLASVGHPILGDGKYGNAQDNRALRQQGIRHQMLHSSEILVPEELTAVPQDWRGLDILDPMPRSWTRITEEYHLTIPEQYRPEPYQSGRGARDRRTTRG